MKLVERFQTLDGQEYKTKRDALQHLDKLYGCKMTSLFNRMNLETDFKYERCTNWIDENLDLFVELKRIKDDMVLDTADMEDDG